MGDWMIISGANLDVVFPQRSTIGDGETEPCIQLTTKKNVKGNKKKYVQTVPELIRKRLTTVYTDPYGGKKADVMSRCLYRAPSMWFMLQVLLYSWNFYKAFRGHSS
jgi:hypothetical protein